MLFFLIVGLLLGAVAVIFALQNITAISVTFLAWHLNGSLALILLLAVIAGIIMSMLVSIPEVLRSHMRLAALRKRNKVLEDENAKLRTMLPQTPSSPTVSSNNPQ